MRGSKLQQITVPKSCRQRRSGSVKRRKEYGGFNWINFGCDVLPEGGMPQCSSCNNDSPSIVGRKMTLIYGERGHGIFQNENIFMERKNKAKFLKTLDGPFTELESATQSTISDSTENRCVGEMEYYMLSQSQCSEMNTGDTTSGAADSYSLNEKKPGSGHLAEGKHGLAKTFHCSQWPVEGFGEKICNPRMGSQDALEKAMTKSTFNHREHCDKRYQNSLPYQHDPSSVEVAWKVSSSSTAKGDETEHRRGKRKRKPKVHFDEEVPFSMRSLWRMRRLKIMRHLGLIAPRGSPFIVNSAVRTAA